MYFLLYSDTFVLSFVSKLKFKGNGWIIHKISQLTSFLIYKDSFRSDRFITNHTMNLLHITSNVTKLTPK